LCPGERNKKTSPRHLAPLPFFNQPLFFFCPVSLSQVLGQWGDKPARSSGRAAKKPATAGEGDENAAGAAPAPRSMSALLAARSAGCGAPTTSAQHPPSSTFLPCARPLADIDARDAADPLSASAYAADIFAYYRRVEPAYRVGPDYMARQADINAKMRAILVDWLVEVHLKFKLLPETLHLTAHLIDRFLERREVSRKNLQLVGVTAMLVAAKYEEIWAPEVRDFVYISDRAYSRDQILAMEKLMLNTLGFALTVPTAHAFVGRCLKAVEGGAGAGAHVPSATCAAPPGAADPALSHYAHYLAELALPEYGMLAHAPSAIAAGAVLAARAALGRGGGSEWPAGLAAHSGVSRAAATAAAAALAALAAKAPGAALHAVHKKYSSPKFGEVARLPPPAAELAL